MGARRIIARRRLIRPNAGSICCYLITGDDRKMWILIKLTNTAIYCRRYNIALSTLTRTTFHIWQQCTIFVMVLIKANRAITETQRIPKATTTTTNIIMKTKTLIINSHHIIGAHKLRVVGLITCKLRLMQRTESTK